MILETFPLRVAGIGAKHHGEGGKFTGSLAKQDTFAPDLAVEEKKTLVLESKKDSAEQLMTESHKLEDELNIILEQYAVQYSDGQTVERLRWRQKIEKIIRESVEVRVADILRNRKDCRTPDINTPEREQLDMRSPRNQVLMVEVVVSNDTNSPIQVIFKPEKGEAVLMEKNGVARGIVESRPQTGYLREWLAGFIAKAFDSEVVPPTVIGKIDNAIGSVQLRVDGRLASCFVGEEWLSTANIKDLREVAALDYILQNTDRHDGNYLIGADGKVSAIDHGLILPQEFFGVLRSFPLRFFSAGDRSLPEALLGRLANLIEDRERYELLKKAFDLVFGPAQGDIYFKGFEKRIRELVRTGQLPEYCMHEGDEKYFWGHAATLLAPRTAVERKKHVA